MKKILLLPTEKLINFYLSADSEIASRLHPLHHKTLLIECSDLLFPFLATVSHARLHLTDKIPLAYTTKIKGPASSFLRLLRRRSLQDARHTGETLIVEGDLQTTPS